jgi:hypothetical protein
MNLQLLDFDCSEDAEGVVCWDALAQPAQTYHTKLLAEVSEVLTWCHQFDAQGPGPLEDGASWDFDLHVTLHGNNDPALQTAIQFDPFTGHVHLHPEAAQQVMTLSLSISGSPAFSLAFREQFGL